MFRQYLVYKFAIVAIVCIATIFLFPTLQGPYSAVHGPVTALLSLRAKIKLWLQIALAGMIVLARHLPADSRSARCKARSQDFLLPLAPNEQAVVLRC